ncbi:MAG: peptidoglycan D,D-transpeptidase FtsI family protein [Planctomycetaceae bacterium]
MTLAYEGRLGLLALLAAAGLLAITAQLFSLQVLEQDEWQARADALVRQTRPVAARRGAILDARGTVLAEDAPAFDLTMTVAGMRASPHPPDSLARLAGMLGMGIEELAARIARAEEVTERAIEREVSSGKSRRKEREARRDHEGRPRVLAADVSYEVAREIDLNAERFGGLRIAVASRRDYPGGADFVHVVGRGDTRPPFLLEGVFKETLTGADGELVLTRPPRRLRIQPRVVEERLAVRGKNLHLTIDAADQRLAMRALEGVEGAFVLVAAESGAILALASAPSYDPGEYARLFADWAARGDERGTPFIDRACRNFHTPGSVLKPFTALAAAEGGILDGDLTIACDGYLTIDGRRQASNRCTAAHGELDLPGALTHSCNIYFQELMLRMDFRAFAAAGRRFGFGEPTGLEIEWPAWQGRFPATGPDARPWPRDERVQNGIGQGTLLLSPAQIARAYAGLATGSLPHLHLVSRVGDRATPVRRDRLDAPPVLLDRIRAALAEVVRPGGTAQGYGLMAWPIHAKTGTAQVGGGLNNAWMAGFVRAHAGRPAVAFAMVVLRTPLHGAQECAPRLADFFRSFYGGSSE